MKRSIVFFVLVNSSCPLLSAEIGPDTFIGKWKVGYLPTGNEALDYWMEVYDIKDGFSESENEVMERVREDLTAEAPGEITPLRGITEIKYLDDSLVIFRDGERSDFVGEAMGGENSAIKYTYARFEQKSDFGVASITLFAGREDRLYGLWQRFFWGLSDEAAPFISVERFILERVGEQIDDGTAEKPPGDERTP